MGKKQNKTTRCGRLSLVVVCYVDLPPWHPRSPQPRLAMRLPCHLPREVMPSLKPISTGWAFPSREMNPLTRKNPKGLSRQALLRALGTGKAGGRFSRGSRSSRAEDRWRELMDPGTLEG